MSDGKYTDDVRAALRTRCIDLLTKEAFLGIPEAHEQAFAHDEGIFWCDRTSESIGPDGEPVCAKVCGKPGRGCYTPPVSL